MALPLGGLLCLLALGLGAPALGAAGGASPSAPLEEVPLAPVAVPVQPALVPETGPTQPPVPAPAVPPPIVSIEVSGNQRLPSSEIAAAVTSKVGGPYSEEQVARDRQAVLNLGWFQTVAVERQSVENGVRLVFRVTENPVIRAIEFEGIKEVTREDLVAVMKTKPGTVYNVYRLAQDAQVIEELYRARGYILAIVVTQRMSEEGTLTLVIAEGVIESIKISGNTYTKTYVIQRYIRTKPGETYNDKKVAQDVTRLTNTGYFETVRRDAEVGTEPGKVILIITVVEKQRTGQATFGGAYTSVQGIIGFVDLTKSNLRGTGQMVTVRGEFGGRRSYELGYRNPWIMTPETRLSLGLYDRYILREAFVTAADGTRRDVLYRERRAGGNVTLGRPLTDHTTAYVGLRRDDVSLSDIAEADKPLLTGPAFAPREVRSLTLATITDTRDNIFNPRGGAYHQFSVELAGLFGGSHFNKYSTDDRRYLRAGKRAVVAVRLLVGTTTGDAPYLEQFLIGGPDSLRGYRVDRFAGSHMAIFNSEYRFPLSSNLIGVAFTDVGDAWGGSIAADPYFRGDKSFTAHVGYGVGVRVQTPVGPLRLDLGFSKEGTETHFGVSHMY
jgi:outer membrane protein insertion porin family